jgi:hypothetical protein
MCDWACLVDILGVDSTAVHLECQRECRGHWAYLADQSPAGASNAVVVFWSLVAANFGKPDQSRPCALVVPGGAARHARG